MLCLLILNCFSDFHSAASLKVSPDRVQHFTGESLTLICDANSTEWRVRKFSKSGYLTHCFSWGIVGRNTCFISGSNNIDGVYWCESETGHFSNAVNITEYSGDIILVSPTHPVTEGDFVTLGCKFRKENVFSDVEFYKNDKLIQADTRGEMTISPVSKSDEGFYTCTGKDSQVWRTWTSQDSWMSVKSSEPKQNSLFSILMIVGLLCGVLLFILLLLFQYRYRESKGSCFKGSQSANQVPATDQAETEGRQYVTLLHGNVCLYDTIRGSEEAEHGRNNEPEENEYINMTTRSATEQ
ncbi:uncharacterized protein LOC121961909 isoform X2 [Plectropomus leopardus]|uniref:uncharacterized protein LOC121961909 isoform X2 n=1 Tax=Plectropomus leopardus TaxID=160734 RepID=UPI001C4AA0F3|nr:uncharacterized protein LOC121961909 isoform X2 [Plectropomus leopardus]